MSIRHLLLGVILSSLLAACNLKYPDKDRDGYGDAGASPVAVPADAPLEGYSDNNGDCDDGEDTTYPGADEPCDGVDNDCDEYIDGTLYYWDRDHDGYGDPDSDGGTAECDGTGGVAFGAVANDDDCDDDDETVNPGAGNC